MLTVLSTGRDDSVAPDRGKGRTNGGHFLSMTSYDKVTLTV
jgi:hypothetical protein